MEMFVLFLAVVAVFIWASWSRESDTYNNSVQMMIEVL